MRPAVLAALVLVPVQTPAPAVSVPLDLTGVRPGPVGVVRDGNSVSLTWPDETARVWRATFSLDPAQPLITAIGPDGEPVVRSARPFYRGETGKRRGGWNAFFDDPASHPEGTRHVQGTFTLRAATVRSVGERVEILFDGLRMGSFDGGLAYTFYPGSRLLQQEAVLTTYDADVAYYYDAGLEMAAAADRQPGNNMRTEVAYYDTGGVARQTTLNGLQPERTPVQARYRTLALKTAGGSVAVFPAPHQYFFPRDFTSNLGFVWHRAWRGRVSLGIRQLRDENWQFYPWVNAPPGRPRDDAADDGRQPLLDGQASRRYRTAADRTGRGRGGTLPASRHRRGSVRGMSTDNTLISVVAPVYNEAETVDELHRRLTAALIPLGSYEIVLVDDGSTDATWDAVRGLAASDSHLRVVRLSRNFGHQVALSAGLDHARGEAVISMDGDLQDPPELIPELVERWRQGSDVVFAVRAQREGETWFKLVTASAFYKLINRVSSVDIPEQAGDFRLLSRRALDALLAMPERARYLRGMSSWIGFRQSTVTYTRDARHAGATKYPLRRMLHFAGDAVTSFSATPIRFVAALGFVSVALCLVALAWTLYVRFFTNETVAGWTSVIVVVLFLGGIQLLSLGIIGQYVGRIFDEVKGRPLYFVEEIVERDDQT